MMLRNNKGRFIGGHQPNYIRKRIGEFNKGKHPKSEYKKGHLNYNLKVSEETKNKIKENSKTNPHFGMKNKHHTEKTKRRHSRLIKKLWKDPNSAYNSKERNEKIREAFKGKTYEEIYGEEKAKIKDKIRLKTYKKYGYKTLIIWGHEIFTCLRYGIRLTEKELVNKIRKFIK